MQRQVGRRSAMLAVASALALPAAVSSRARAAGPVALRVSSAAPPDKFGGHYLWFEPFAAALKAAVGDAIRLDYFPNAQLGKEADIVQQVKVGSVDMMITGTSNFAGVAAEIGALDLGYLFDDYAHCARAMDAGVGEFYDKVLTDRGGIHFLGLSFQVGARSVYTKVPITSLSQLGGVKLRVLPTQAFIETFKIMGAIPTPIPINELYTAVQTGVVDGFEHDPGTVNAYKLFEITKHCLLTKHLYSPMAAAIGRRGLAKIPQELMPAFRKAADEATAANRASVPAVEAEAMSDLRARGVGFTEMIPAERDRMKREMAERLYADFVRRYPATKAVFETIERTRTAGAT